MGRLLAMLALGATAALGGCATVASSTEKGTAALGQLLLSHEDERRLGAQLAADVESKEPVHKDPEVQRYVDRVGHRILSAVPKEDRAFDFEFTVLDTPDTVNAFALPGGHIFINSGLLAAADTEAELAGVLGHEVAHVLAGHPAKALGAQVGLQTLASLALGENPGMIAQLGTAVVGQGYLAAHSRDAESEADSLGLGYLAKAGYQPEAMATFFEKLDKLGGAAPNAVAKFFASHPQPGDRAGVVRDLIAERGYRGGRDAIIGNFNQLQAQAAPNSKVGQLEETREPFARR